VKFSSQFSIEELERGNEPADCCTPRADFSRDLFADDDSLEVLTDVRTDHPTSTPEVWYKEEEHKDPVLLAWFVGGLGLVEPSQAFPGTRPDMDFFDNEEVQRTVSEESENGKFEETEETKSENSSPTVNSSTTVLKVLDEIYGIITEETASTNNDIKAGSSEIKEVQYENIQTAPSENEFHNVSGAKNERQEPINDTGNKFETGRRKEGV